MTTLTLSRVLATLSDFDPWAAIFVPPARPIRPDSPVRILRDGDEVIPGFDYLLPITTAQEVLGVWSGWRAKAAPSPAEAVAAVEWYAEDHGYLPVDAIDDSMVAAIAEDYFAPLEGPSAPDRPNLRRSSTAWALITELVRSDPEKGWALIVALADRAPDEDGVGLLGAGPVEDFVREHGEAYLDLIDEAATRGEKLRAALTYTYGWDKQPQSVRERLSRHFPSGDFDGPPLPVTFSNAD